MTFLHDVDVCVVGSGFGGGPAALRAATAGASVVVLEQGRRYDDRPGSVEFRQTQTELDYLLELFKVSVGLDLETNAASVVLGGKGLGGGSLVYSMVSLRAPSFVFDDPVWPEGIDRTVLDPYYQRAEEQLGVVQLQWSGTPGVDDWRVSSLRDAAFATMCERADVSCDPVPVAINDRCGNLGWCTTGCVRHGKNSVDLRYLQPAEAAGAVLHTGVTASSLRPADAAGGRRWRVQTDRGVVAADHVVLAGGAVGTPALLLSSAPQLPHGLSPHVGRNLSRGGDMMIPIVLPEDLGLEDLEMLPGKIIGSCSFQYLFEPPPGFGEDWQRFVLQPMQVLPMISALLTADPDGITVDGGDMRSFGQGQKHLMQHWGSRLLHVGVMGMDGMDGHVDVIGGVPFVNYRTSARTRALFAAARSAVHHIFDRGVGGRALPTLDELRPDSMAIHPLGSARMADTVAAGAVDRAGRVFRADGRPYDGLVVADASLMSSPIAVNTSLTAAALSEMVVEQLLGR
jgi:choline dehydrogenase-like flavoprotein